VEEAIACYRQAIALDPKFAAAHNNLGSALQAKGKVEEAIACFRRAIALAPRDGTAHGALGKALLQKGHFAEARDASARALQLLPRGHPLRTVVSRQLAECRRLATLQEKLSRILRGEAAPTGTEERLQLASLCQRKQMHVTAFHFWTEAFAADPKQADDLQQQHRYNAACSAARASAGQADDGRFLPDKVTLKLRRQAWRWLKADLALWARQVEQGEVGTSRLARLLSHWQKDPDLASVRAPEALDRLDADERQQWRRLWQDVDALLEKPAARK
jgi:tetratricopeptide (TPR) repeat protein